MSTSVKKFRIIKFKKENPIIEFKNVSFAYGNRLILDNISFKIQSSQVFGMLGPNGAGKSTIFNLICGLIHPKQGKIFIDGKDATNFHIYERAKTFLISYCPQIGGAFSDLTTKDNLKAISEIVIEDESLRSGRIDYLLSKFELENVKDIKAKHLSGGQRRKLVVALALLRKPKILLLDEPFIAMDLISVRMLQEIIVNLQHEEQISVLVTDHQAKELLSVTDSAMILSNAKIIAQDTPNNLLKHREAIRSYFGSSFKLNS
tara:strand:+ start:41 stop:823 length:783 start_codon:yes stop_codon:yes gene_type:complete